MAIHTSRHTLHLINLTVKLSTVHNACVGSFSFVKDGGLTLIFHIPLIFCYFFLRFVLADRHSASLNAVQVASVPPVVYPALEFVQYNMRNIDVGF